MKIKLLGIDLAKNVFQLCALNQAMPSDNDLQTAYACDSAKRQLLEAETDDDFDRAERRIRLLCN